MRVKPATGHEAIGRSGIDLIRKPQKGFVTGTVQRTAWLKLARSIMTIATIIMVTTGGVITVPLSSGLTGGGGDGIPAGGILPGATILIAPVMNAMARSTATTTFRPKK